MEDNLIHERYKDLAVAVIKQRIDDYMKDNSISADDRFYIFCTTNYLFEFLDLDGEMLYAKTLRLKEVRRNNRKNRRKINNLTKGVRNG